jgi:acetoin utilization deacetylase AcuC-like enzyme
VPTAVFRDPVYQEHDVGPHHPENRGRLVAVEASLDREPIPGTLAARPRRATRPELLRVHVADHVDLVERSSRQERAMLDSDTPVSARSCEAALHAAGAGIQAVEQVLAGAASGAFALVRPPGHHAEADRAMGFCLFNNVAVAAAHALAEGGVSRILVVDPDVHHGNGTEHAFFDRPEVLYASSHRYPFYPGTGAVDETGEGAGQGYTVNLPLPAGQGDADFLHVYEEVLEPIVDQYRPELILVSAGFDTWQRDPMGGMRMTADGFAALYALFRRWADRHCPGRIVCTLEGGYDPPGLVLGVRAAIAALAAPRAPDVRIDAPPSAAARHVAGQARRALSGRWSFPAGRR